LTKGHVSGVRKVAGSVNRGLVTAELESEDGDEPSRTDRENRLGN
jgi:hypothetical protein